jgi:probable DNA repair protein
MRWQQLVRASTTAETVPAPDAIPLRNPEVTGGSALFRNQAACAFKAFALHRLGAEPLERVQAGLDPMRRGTVVHEVLERLWLELQSLAGLQSLDETALRSMVRGRIDEVLEEQRRRSPATFTYRFTDVEARRLEGRVLAWLDIERQRSPFAVTGHERLQHFEIGGLRLRLKIDRVDELEDGARVVLDYKTGTVTPAHWFGERPEDPQLPLYGVASLAEGPQAAPVAAVAFAQIKSDQLGFRGVVREAGILPGLPVNRKGELKDASDTWPAVLDSWAEELERLALAYREGDAAVDPKHGLKTCQDTYCELAPLCRVRESLPGSGAEVPDEEGPLDG